MAASNAPQAAQPLLETKAIADSYVRKNFEKLNDHFSKQNQLRDFGFFDLIFAAAAANFKVSHGFAFVPQDVIVTKVTGAGTVTFNHGLFDLTNIDLTVTGACRVRFFVGSYWNLINVNKNNLGDVTQYSPEVQSSSSSNMTAASSATSLVPPGSIFPYAGTTAPAGYLLCDGSSISRVTYADLFAIIGTNHGTANSSTFNVPDYRGRFLRGWDNAAGRDPNSGTRTAMNTGGQTADKIGTLQTDSFQGHYHTVATKNGGQAMYQQGGGVTSERGPSIAADKLVTNPWEAEGAIADGTNGTPRTSTETRPINAYVNYIIKT